MTVYNVCAVDPATYKSDTGAQRIHNVRADKVIVNDELYKFYVGVQLQAMFPIHSFYVLVGG